MIGQRIERAKEKLAAEALSKGLQKGRQEGLQKGLLEGRQKGLLEGRQKGLLEGRQKGRHQGRLEGRLEGLQEGRQTMLRELLEQKFGAVDPRSDARLREASLDQLLHWSRRVLAADTLDDVFADDGSDDRMPD